MTSEAALLRIIKTWQKRLKIEHIALEISLDPGPESPDAVAAVQPDSLYDIAEVQFRDDWPTHDLFTLNRIVVHELLHVMFRDYSNAIRSIGMSGVLSYQVERVWRDHCTDAEEGLVDRLAWRLVEIGGVVK